MKLDEMVSQNFEKLNASDEIIWRYIVAHRRACCDLPIDELARRCNMSRSTVMRFAQKLGLHGYSDLKALLRLEYGDEEDETGSIVDAACDSVIDMVERFRSKDCTDIFQALHRADRIFVYGTGGVQRSAVAELKRLFLNVNVFLQDIPGEGELEKVARMMTEDDLVLIVSKSGESPAIKKIAVAIKSRGAKLVSCTHSGASTLANLSDYNLFIDYGAGRVLEGFRHDEATRLLVLMQLLYVKYIAYLKSLSAQ